MKSPRLEYQYNDKTTDSDEVYFNTKACLYIYKQVDKLDHLLNWSRLDCPVRVGRRRGMSVLHMKIVKTKVTNLFGQREEIYRHSETRQISALLLLFIKCKIGM